MRIQSALKATLITSIASLITLVPNGKPIQTDVSGHKALIPVTLTQPLKADLSTQSYIVTKELPKPVETPANPPAGNIEAIVRAAAIKYGVDPNYLVRIGKCESGLNPRSVNYNYSENGNPSGLFQHLSGYYPARAKKYGYSTDVFDAYSNANVTAAMFKDGLQGLWECK